MKQYRGDEAAARVHRLNKNMEEEAIVVRIITLVTLIYLPATFVSTFFSTDIIKYADEDHPDGMADGLFSNIAMNRWLQVTLPLTFLTLFAAWGGKAWASRQSDKMLEDSDPAAEKLHLGGPLHIIGEWVRSRRTPTQSTAKTLLPTTSGFQSGNPTGGKSAAG